MTNQPLEAFDKVILPMLRESGYMGSGEDIRSALSTLLAQQRKEAYRKIEDLIAEFGDNPGECLGIINGYVSGEKEVQF